MVRTWLASFAMSRARSFGRVLGCELVVEVSDHSLKTTMEVPNRDDRAWDDSLFKNGQLYVDGYANPVKPTVRPADNNGELDDVEAVEGEGDLDDESDEDDEYQVGIIPSHRYKTFMNQHIISELMNPREQWRLIVFGIIALGGLSFLQMLIVMYVNGAF